MPLDIFPGVGGVGWGSWGGGWWGIVLIVLVESGGGGVGCVGSVVGGGVSVLG